MTKKSQKEAFSKVEIAHLPVGKLLSKRSFLSSDETTQKGIAQLQEIISKNEEGMAVFLAHLGLLDVFGTAMILEKSMDYKAVFPVAGSWYHFPILNSVFQQIQSQVHHEFIPVFRKEEFRRVAIEKKIIDFSHLTDEEKKAENQAYVARTEKLLEDEHGAVVLAPYAGRAPKEEFLRSGPITLLQSGRPIILTLTSWDWKAMKYVIYFSEVYRFSDEITKQEAHATIYNEYSRMAELAGVSEQKMLQSKDGSPTTKVVWGVLATILSAYLLWSAKNIKKKRSKNQEK